MLLVLFLVDTINLQIIVVHAHQTQTTKKMLLIKIEQAIQLVFL